MVFSSLQFVCLFFPIVIFVNVAIKKELSNYWLLIVSLLFYGLSEPKLVYIFIMQIVINYILGIVIDANFFDKSASPLKRKIALIISLVLNLGVLIYFKYLGFFTMIANGILVKIGVLPLDVIKITMPIGISFYTFQMISYLLDVYWKKVSVQKNILKLALYVSLFPQLIAGPIVRYIDVEKEINNRDLTSENLFYGIKRFSIGLGKKVLIANNAAVFADLAFNANPESLIFYQAWIGVICYSIQIYFDFSAYSDMAIGMGKMMGFNFLENFNYPYIATSVKEFWRRWHISLSSFFKDYLYIPLGGNRKGKVRTYLNNLIVFGLCGLWHGASWNFIVWGLYHGAFLIFERNHAVESLFIRIPNYVKRLYTIIVVMIGWIFFRADNLTHAIKYIYALLPNLSQNKMNLFIYISEFKLYAIIIVGFLFSTPIYLSINKNKFTKYLVDISLIVTVIISMIVLATTDYNPFIYFRF